MFTLLVKCFATEGNDTTSTSEKKQCFADTSANGLGGQNIT